MAVYENTTLEQLVDVVPSDKVNDGEADEPHKKTRRSRRGGYRRKRQQQKKVAALMAESEARRASGCDSASTASTEEETSSSESSATNSPQRACARKRNPNPQQQQYHHHQGYYQQGPMHPAAVPMYPPYPAYGYGYPPAPTAHTTTRQKKMPWNLTQEQKNRYVALDCEMVGVGEYGEHSCVARVTLVDWNGDIVLDEMIKPQWEVADYRTFVSGITKEMLDNATMDFGTCRKLVLKHLKGKILVGHALKNDLGVLGIDHPWHMIRDTAKYEPFMKVRFQDGVLWPRGLKDLCREWLNREVQVYGRPHCPKEDAVAALDLYKLVWRQWEKSMGYKMNRAWAMQPAM